MVLFTRPLAAAAALLTTAAEAASLEEVTDFGTNPSGAKMHIYVPDAVAGQQQQQDDNSKSTAAPVVVAIHFCTGTGPVYYASTPYAKLADEHGFVVVYPSSPHDGGCWDVSSAEAMQHQDASTSTSTSDTKGSDTAAIAQMTRWAVATYGGGSGAARAYVTGSSSGAMMTNLLAATYPDLFAAAVAYSGVPAGCFFTGTVAGWNATCSQGKSVSSQEGWRDVALAMYPGYQGSRPKMLILHGSADTSVLPENFNETIKQWTGVFGYSLEPAETLPKTPSDEYTKYVYGDNVVGIYGEGVGHSVPVMGDQDMAWFGIA